jgi:hypothetical protein
MDYKSIDGTPAEIAERYGHKDILDLLSSAKMKTKRMPNRSLQATATAPVS